MRISVMSHALRRACFPLALLLAGCNFAVPQVTPTVAPSRTPTVKPIVSATPSRTPTLTLEPTAIVQFVTATDTQTPLPSLTPSNTPTGTLPPSPTPSRTWTPSPTPTATITNTPLPTWTPSSTLTRLPPSETATLMPTETPVPSATATFTPRATDTPLPTSTATPIPTSTTAPTVTPLPQPSQPTATNTPVPPTQPAVVIGAPVTLTQPPTTEPTLDVAFLVFTPTPLELAAVPTSTPATSTAGPTLDATPTFITQDAPITISGATPIPATTTPEGDGIPTNEPTPAATPSPLPFGAIPQVVIPAPPAALPGTLNYALTISGGRIQPSAFSIPQNPILFAQNPANPDQYAAVNGAGQIFFVRSYASQNIDRVWLDIFTNYHYEISSIADNDAAVVDVAWAQDGTLAFIIHGEKVNKDGVWFWQPEVGGRQFLRDCPPEQGCQTVTDTAGLSRWESVDIRWSPGSDAILTTLDLPDEGRRAFTIIDRATANPEVVPGPVCRFDEANWAEDGQRVIVAGRGPGGEIVLGSVSRFCDDFQGANMGDLGWSQTRDPVQYNGGVYALAARAPGSPVQVVDVNGSALTEPIGNNPPDRVAWSPDRSAVLVFSGGRYYIADVVSRSVQEITQQVVDAQAVQWVLSASNVPPTIAPAVEQAIQPPAPAQPETLQPGDQVAVIGSLLNLRETASTSSSVVRILDPGQALQILGGPTEAGGFPWYQVQLDDGTQGWVASFVFGSATIQKVG